MGYQKFGGFGSSSFGSNRFKMNKGVENASNITMIKDVDTMMDNITEGQCFSISKFAIAENSGKLPLLPHKYKISFYKGTVVTRINPFDNNVNGFILEPFNRLLDDTRHYHEHEVVDVIGSVVQLETLLMHSLLLVAKYEGLYLLRMLNCTFWDHWATMWDEYAQKRNELSHVVFILQLGNVKYWDVQLYVFNFYLCVKELPKYDESQFKTEAFTPQEPVVTIAEFFYGAINKMVTSIRECELKTTALCMQGFIDSIKRMGRHIPPARNAIEKWMLWIVKLPHLQNYVRKFLQALSLRWRPKVTTIEEAKDLVKLPFDELIRNLKVYEMVLRNDGVISKSTKENVKFLALKAKITRGQTSNNSVCQDGSDKDEDKDKEEEFNSMMKNL
uniref:Replication protein A 70 kDa DNA-binding subunit B n=1 Tax=Tanacetum cinerariifolium TaxID=118510 RepID=A0A6L2KQM6_TANCI|nr:replication protein A 70 kDa DNA-binding subunit B [Tanacetum cinerariifolium]